MNLELATASSALQSSSHWSEHLSLDRRPGHVAQGVFVVSGRVAPHIKRQRRARIELVYRKSSEQIGVRLRLLLHVAIPVKEIVPWHTLSLTSQIDRN